MLIDKYAAKRHRETSSFRFYATTFKFLSCNLFEPVAKSGLVFGRFEIELFS